MRQGFPNLTRTPQIEYHHGITCSGCSDDRGMKYHQSVSTRSSVWYLDRVVLVMAVSLGLFGLVAWAILPPSQAPLGTSLGPCRILARDVGPRPGTASVSHQADRQG